MVFCFFLGTINNKPLQFFKLTEKRFNQIFWYKRSGAKTRNIKFELTKEDLFSILVETCPILNIKLHYSGKIGYCKDNLFSIDRINPKLGYIVGNCRIISYKVNRAKSNVSKNRLKKIYRYVKKNIIKTKPNQ